MEFALSTEQEDFQRTLRQFITEKSPLAKVREVVERDPGYDPDLWSYMGEQLGLPGLLLTEEYGGSDATMIEVALVMEELGRGLVPSPFFATVALGVVPILLAGSEEQKKELLPAIAAGRHTVTTAISESEAAGAPNGVLMRAAGTRHNITLSGVKTHVIDGHSADSVIVIAAAPDEPADLGFYLVDGTAPGLVRTRVETFDPTRSMATLQFDEVPAVPLGEAVGSGTVSHFLDVANVLLAAEMVGGIEAAMTMAVEYAKVRHQFNRPIGSFQAIKHRCAEMAVELDTSRAATLYAAHVAAEGSDELAIVAPLTRATAASGFDFAASWNIQIHGGIGFTWEQDAHLYYRRAKADQVLFGSVREHWLQLADRIGL